MSTNTICMHTGPRWATFARARDGVGTLDTVQRGMQIGALAMLSDATYAQLNGDVVETLNAGRVRTRRAANTAPRRHRCSHLHSLAGT